MLKQTLATSTTLTLHWYVTSVHVFITAFLGVFMGFLPLLNRFFKLFPLSNSAMMFLLSKLKCSPQITYGTIWSDVLQAFDMVHMKGPLHSNIMKYPDRFIERNPNLPKLLEYLQSCGESTIREIYFGEESKIVYST